MVSVEAEPANQQPNDSKQRQSLAACSPDDSLASPAVRWNRSRPCVRELTENERQLLAKIECKQWMVKSQWPPEKYQGPTAIVNYLAGYVRGTAIGNGRILEDDGRQVTFRYKDYRDDQQKTLSIDGPEFVQRFCLHILPRGLQRVRYGGLFQAKERDQRLEHCRQLLGASSDRPLRAELSAVDSGDTLSLTGEEDLDEDEEPLEPSGCTCRHCKGELSVVGRLKGLPTLRLMRVAAALLLAAPLLAQWWASELPRLLRDGGRLPSSRLPSSIRKLVDSAPWSPLEISALAALLDGAHSQQLSLLDGQYHVGVPPPTNSEVPAA